MDGDRLRHFAGVVEDFNLARLNKEKLEQTITDVDKGFTIAKCFGATVVQFANWAIWSASRTGKAMEWRVCSAIITLLSEIFAHSCGRDAPRIRAPN